ncbi:MAG: DUF362 domain-containing protein [Desulfobacterales bacterium]|jgi:uncharacterized Fe-S center protein
MADNKCEPTKWTNMKGPVDGGRDTYQAKSWNPPKEKWGPFTEKGTPEVWFAEANATNWTESMICKAKDLFYEAKLNECFKKGDEVAIKIHYGEYNRTAILRPEYIAAIVEEVKACGGHPYVVNDTTLSYHTHNSMAISQYQLEGAIRHGYTDATFGCPVLIADGYAGEDDYRVDIPEGLIIKETYIGRAIAEADAMIVLAHARGHTITMYGGILKQLGIGCQSKRGKYITHLAHWGDPHDAIGWPKFTDSCPGKACDFHKMCDNSCPRGAHKVFDKGKRWYPERCRLCYSCQVTCMFSGHAGICFEEMYFPNAMIAHADAALGALKCFERGKVGYINHAIDVVPECDCFPWAGLAVCPDVGLFAGKDLIAVEMATLDAIDAAPISPGSVADEKGLKPGDDKFREINGFSPRITMAAGAKIGLGTMKYKLNNYEPILNQENAAKWQIRGNAKKPTTVRLRDTFYRHDLATEVMPFKRIEYNKDWVWNEWKKYDPFKGVQPD